MNDPALYRHLVDAAEAGYPALASEIARAYLRRLPESFAVLLHYGIALQELARHDEAEDALLQAERLAAGPERALVRRQRGSLAEARGRDDAAVDLYRQAIELAPEDPRGYVALGSLLVRRGRADEALRALRRAVTCTDGEVEEAYCHLGVALRSRGEYLEALGCFRAALELDPDYPLAQEGLADVEHVLFQFPAE